MTGAPLVLNVLGGPFLVAGESTIELPPLSAWLALVVHQARGDGVRREILAQLLWSDPCTKKTAQRLRQLIYETNLRAATPIVVAKGTRLFLGARSAMDGAWDAHRLRTLADQLCPLGSAPTSSCLPKLPPAPTARAKTFILREEKRLRLALGRFAETQWDLADATSRWSDAHVAARVMLWLTPDDAAWAARLRVSAAACGRASRQDEWSPRSGGTPSEWVAVHPREPSKSYSVISPPFLGRHNLVNLVTGRLVPRTPGNVTFLIGEPGIGRSRTLEAVKTKCELRGRRVVLHSCSPLEAANTFGLLRRILSAGPLDLQPDETQASECPDIRASLSLSEALCDALQDSVLLLDDLQWADPGSIFVLRQALDQPTVQFDLVAALHTGFGPTALTDWLAIQPTAATFALAPLDDDSSIALARWHLRRAGRDPLDAPAVADPCHGNPAAIAAVAALDDAAHHHSLQAPPLWSLTIQRTLASADWTARTALSAVLLFGPVHLTSTSRLLAFPEMRTADSLTFWVRRGWMHHDEAGFDIRNPLLASELLKCLEGPLLHLVLQRGQTLGLEPLPLSQALTRACPPALTPQRAALAARQALDSGALHEADQLYHLAISTGETQPEGELLEAAARCKLHQCQHEEGIRLLSRAEAWYASHDLDGKTLQVRALRLDAASEVGRIPHHKVSRELSSLLQEARAAGQWDCVLDGTEALIRVAERSGSTAQILDALNHLAADVDGLRQVNRCRAAMLLTLKVFFGDPEEGLSEARRACRLARTTNDAVLQVKSYHRLYVALVQRGLGATLEASETYEALSARSRAIPDVSLRYTTLANRAVWLMEMGAFDPARDILERARATLTSSATGETLNYHLNSGECALRSRDYDAAARAFESAERHLVPGSRDHLRDIALAGVGLVALRRGRLSEAERVSHQLRDWSTWHFDPTLLVEFRIEWLRRVGKANDTLDYLEGVCAALRSRYIGAWLRMEVLRGQFAKRAGRSLDVREVSSAVAAARDLNLRHRVGELQRLLD